MAGAACRSARLRAGRADLRAGRHRFAASTARPGTDRDRSAALRRHDDATGAGTRASRPNGPAFGGARSDAAAGAAHRSVRRFGGGGAMTVRAQAPKVDLDATRTQLERVGLYRAAEQLEVLVGEAV